jgi:ABC-type microcin C transport system permease subunit YejE
VFLEGEHMFVSASPSRRAWQRFKRNKLGYYSLLVFSALVLISLFAELVSNDKPLIIHYKNSSASITPALARFTSRLPKITQKRFLVVILKHQPIILTPIFKKNCQKTAIGRFTRSIATAQKR